jgi:hypothetical protein
VAAFFGEKKRTQPGALPSTRKLKPNIGPPSSKRQTRAVALATRSTVEKLEANGATVEKLEANGATVEKLEANGATVEKLEANGATVEKLEANAMTRPGKHEANGTSPDERADEAHSGYLLS